MKSLARSLGLVLLVGSGVLIADDRADPPIQRHVGIQSAAHAAWLSATLEPEKLAVAHVLWPVLAHGVDADTLPAIEAQLGHSGYDAQVAALPPSYKAVWCREEMDWKFVCCLAADVAVTPIDDVLVRFVDEVAVQGAFPDSFGPQSISVEHAETPGVLGSLDGPEVDALCRSLTGLVAEQGFVDAARLADALQASYGTAVSSPATTTWYELVWNEDIMEWEIVCHECSAIDVELATEGTVAIEVETITTPRP